MKFSSAYSCNFAPTVAPFELVTLRTPMAGHPALAIIGLPETVIIFPMISRQPLDPFADGLPLISTFVLGK